MASRSRTIRFAQTSGGGAETPPAGGKSHRRAAGEIARGTPELLSAKVGALHPGARHHNVGRRSAVAAPFTVPGVAGQMEPCPPVELLPATLDVLRAYPQRYDDHGRRKKPGATSSAKTAEVFTRDPPRPESPSLNCVALGMPHRSNVRHRRNPTIGASRNTLFAEVTPRRWNEDE